MFSAQLSAKAAVPCVCRIKGAMILGYDLIVVGGGAAGMMAAVQAGRLGKKVLLLERGEKTGRKLLITGKGRCNVTNNCVQETLLQNIPENPRFLYSAFSRFVSSDWTAVS